MRIFYNQRRIISALIIGLFLSGVPFSEELRLAERSFLAPGTSFRNGSVAFGTICDEAHTQAFTGLNAQIKGIFNVLRKSLQKRGQAHLTEEETDQAYRNSGVDFDFEGQREEVKDFLRMHLSQGQEVPKIFFLNPPGNRFLFWVNGEYAAAQYSPTNNSIYLSLSVVQYALDILGQSGLNAIAYHEHAHLAGASHEEAIRLHQGINPDVDLLIDMMVEEEQELPSEEWQLTEEEAGGPLSVEEAVAVDLYTAGIQLQGPSQPEWTGYERLDMPRGKGLSEVDWFRERITENSEPDAQGKPKGFEEALKEWKVEMACYVYEMGRCSFGHNIIWGFNYYHPTRHLRLELGQDEMVSFGLISPDQREEIKRSYKERARRANSQWLYLPNYLAVIRNNLEALLASEGFDEEDRVKLKALAKVASVGHYYELIDVLGQKVEHQGEFLSISYEDVERYMRLAGALADEGKIRIDRSRYLPTELQRLRLQIASAVTQAQRGDTSGWDRLAAKYSLLLENISAFTIKVATMIRFVGHLKGPMPEGAKGIQDIRRWGFFGSGPAMGVRALNKINALLVAAGIGLSNIQFYDFDFSQPMLDEGKRVVQQIAERVAFEPVKRDILNERIPLGDNSLDFAETGLMGTIGEGSNSQGLNKKMYLLLELNRVIDKGGYLVLTVKNKPLPKEFQDALRGHFGFKIITRENQDLGYDDETLARLTKGDNKKIAKLKSHLRGASYLIAVKEKDLNEEEGRAIVDRQAEISKVLAYDDSYEAQQRRARAHRQITMPEEVDIAGLDYSGFKISEVAQRNINRETIMTDSVYEEFEDRLACLIYLKEHLNAKDKKALDEIVRLWDTQRAKYLTEEQVEFVMERPLGKNKGQGFNYERLIGAYPHLKRQIDEENTRLMEETRDKKARETSGGRYGRRGADRAYEFAIKKFERELKNRVYTFWAIYQIENQYRAQRGMADVFEQTRTAFSKRIRAIKKVVAEYISQGQTPNFSVVAEKLGLSGPSPLLNWAKRNEIDLVAFGVVPAGFALVDMETRIQEIRKVVEELISEGQTPNVSAVARKLGLGGQSPLTTWAKVNKVDLASLGVVIEGRGPADKEGRIQEIMAAVEELKSEGQTPNLRSVARKLVLSPSALSRWARRNKVDLAALGIVAEGPGSVDKEGRIQGIRAAVAELESEGQSPNLTAVSKKLELVSPEVLSHWAKANKVDLASLGVDIEGPGSVDKEGRIQGIRAAVAELESAGQTPSLRSVARKLVLGPSALSRWANRHGVDLESLGVEPGLSKSAVRATDQDL